MFKHVLISIQMVHQGTTSGRSSTVNRWRENVVLWLYPCLQRGIRDLSGRGIQSFEITGWIILGRWGRHAIPFHGKKSYMKQNATPWMSSSFRSLVDVYAIGLYMYGLFSPAQLLSWRGTMKYHPSVSPSVSTSGPISWKPMYEFWYLISSIIIKLPLCTPNMVAIATHSVCYCNLIGWEVSDHYLLNRLMD